VEVGRVGRVERVSGEWSNHLVLGALVHLIACLARLAVHSCIRLDTGIEWRL
jgi:hypothetical protein